MTSILKFKFNDCPGSFAQERDRNGEGGERKQKTMKMMRRNRRGGRSSSWRNTYLDIYICCVWFSCVAVFSVSLPSPLLFPFTPLSHFIVFGLWLHSKFISMTLRRRRRWSSSSASQLPREPQGLWHAPLAIIPAQHKFVCDADSIIDLGFDLSRATTTTTITITMSLSIKIFNTLKLKLTLKCDLPRPFP